METPQYFNQIFPKGINDEVYNEHLRVYSKTLICYVSYIQQFVPGEYHALIPYGVYLCPLCLKNHFIKTNSGVIGNSKFSLDHLPPKSAGGTYKVITCKKCNNDSGTSESELEKLLNFAVDKKKSAAGISLKVQVRDPGTGKSIQGFFHNKNGEGEIRFDENKKKYNRDYVDFLSKLHSKKLEELKIEVPLQDEKKVERALLKSAYLLCFVWWGYEFVFSENGALIRDVIAGEKDYPCHVPLNWLEKEAIRPNGISIMQDGNERIAFLVNINLKGIEVNTTACILIPSPTRDGWAKLSSVKEMNKAGQSKAFTCITLPRIVDRIGYSVSWNIVIPPPSRKSTL
jgi:hypothetical protein